MPGPIISENLQAAFERLRPKLPELLGTDYMAFMAQLEALLAGGSDRQVLDLLRKYSVVREHLLDILEEENTIRGGLGIYGDTQIYSHPHKHSLPHYRCETGLHDIAADQVEERDAVGNALCPLHGVPLIMVVEKGNAASQEQE